jgi:hypothetical protein
MPSHTERRTVDLSAYPDLTVVYLGMRLNRPSGIFQILRFWPQVKRSVEARPDGLLLHEYVIWGLRPLHLGMRQYWRDFDALETWVRQPPHQRWWGDFLRASRGAGFWHETYSRRRGFEAVYDDLAEPPGLGHFAPLVPADGPLYSARKRLDPVATLE